MNINIPDDDVQVDALEDFFIDYDEAYERCVDILLKLEIEPEDSSLHNELFRIVHTIKGNCNYVGVFTPIPILQQAEDILDNIRKGYICYDSLLCDAVLLILDSTSQIIKAIVEKRPPFFSHEKIERICHKLTEVTSADDKTRIDKIRDLVIEFDPQSELQYLNNDSSNLSPNLSSESNSDLKSKVINNVEDNTPDTNVDIIKNIDVQLSTEFFKESDIISAVEYQAKLHKILAHYKIELDDDLNFFIGLVPALESRTAYWKGRTARILFLAMELNAYAGSPIENDQLCVAVMMHDMALSFFPKAILDSTDMMADKNVKQWRQFTSITASLIGLSERWKVASKIIAEHQEFYDGTGFPNGLKGDEIHAGAEILHMVDIFDANTHEYANQHGIKRPLVRAILEINNLSGFAFREHWVDIFNDVIKLHYNQYHQ
jgi:response regulator RpfG family c-di-GMP phosphodiesterase